MTIATKTTEFVALDRLLPPRVAMRVKFDDTKFQELIASIRTNGLIAAIVVVPEGNNLRVVAGHRRFEACKQIGLLQVEVKIVTAEEGILEALKCAENIAREDVNPADEAAYLDDLLKEYCSDDVEQLCALTKLSFSYVSERLNLFRGDPRVYHALRAGELSLGVSGEFNRILSDASRFAAIETAKKYGCTVRQARQWRTEYNLQSERDAAAASGQPPSDPVPTARESHGPLCVCCEQNKDVHELQLIYVHSYCGKAILQPILDSIRVRPNGAT